MGKLLVAVIIVFLGYFVFIKRKVPPKEIQVTEQQEEQPDTKTAELPKAQPAINTPGSTASLERMKTETAMAVVSAPTQVSDDIDENSEQKDEIKENVDQTVIGNEKRLAEAKSAEEVFDLLRKLRIRPKNLDNISKEATMKDFSKFWGSYEGSALNNRNEVIYGLKINLAAPAQGVVSDIIGKYQLSKPSTPVVESDLSTVRGVQLIGRDGIVFGVGNAGSYFQLYKLDNGYLAGNYYEKTSKRTRTYRFVLKNK